MALVSTMRAADGGIVVEVRGDIDSSSSGELRAALLAAVAQRPARVVVDLRYVTFIDSTGTGALAAGYNAACGQGTAFTLRDPSPFTAQQLRITGLYSRLVEAPR